MSDLISRKATINTVINMRNRCGNDINDFYDLLIESFKVLPSAEPEWIPTSERLPEKEGRYLVTNSRIGSWIIDVDQWFLGHWIKDDKPVAWMPLPEPYAQDQR